MLASSRAGALAGSSRALRGGGGVVVAGHNKRQCRRRVCAAASSASPSPSSSSSSAERQQKQQLAADAAARSFQPPPHSGYHFDGSPRRFFEGWYFKVDLPRLEQQQNEGGGREATAGGGGAGRGDEGDGRNKGGSGGSGTSSSTDSLALIYSVEDPGDASSGVRGVGVQLMGPGDGYLCQFSRDTRAFWADPRRLALGACLAAQATDAAGGAASPPPPPRTVVAPAAFDAAVREGFQASTTWHQGRVVADERGAAGAPMSTVRSAEWCFSVRPAQGWGGGGGGGGASGSAAGSGPRLGLGACAADGAGDDRPLATAGWLSALSVFEPHWQVLVADGLATGWVRWGDGGGGKGEGGSDDGGADADGDGGRVRHFVDAPFYAEKNWGGGFPSKWMWVQCNSFTGAPGVSVTAVGARRALLAPGATGGAGGAAAAATGAPSSPAAPPASSALGALVGSLLGGEEDVGMIGIHLPPGLAASRGLPTFLELVPWRGDVEWSASPWGRWWVRACGGGGGGGALGGGAFGGGGGGGDGEIEAVLEAECDADAGTVLRAPTGSRGLAPFCRDTFAGRVRLRVWRRRGGRAAWAGSGGGGGGKAPAPLLDVSSENGALEVGGGPWVGEWTARAAMREPFRSLVRLPIDVGAVRDALPEAMRPPGL